MATVFLSYSHKDEALKNELLTHLAMLKRDGTISVWHDREIKAGDTIDTKIRAQLLAADIIMFLVSSDFLNSSYCYDIELRQALPRHERGEARIIPVILRPCDWHNSLFVRLNALPTDGVAVTKWADKDEAFLNIVGHIRKVLPTPSGSSGQIREPTETQNAKADQSVYSVMGKVKDAISLLRGVVRNSDPNMESTLSDTELAQHFLAGYSATDSGKLLEAFKKASDIVSAVQRSQKVESSRLELNNLQRSLEDLNERLTIPLRCYQQQLAGAAVEATVAAVLAGRRDIGTLYQPFGSGLSMTITAYVALAVQQIALHPFTVVIVADRAVFVAQLTQRFHDLGIDTGRPIRTLLGSAFVESLRRHPMSIFVTTYQSLRLIPKEDYSSLSILLVESDLFHKRSVVLPNAHRITFTTDAEARVIGKSLIGAYTRQQLIREGYSCAILVEQRSASWFSEVRIKVEAVHSLAKDIVEHFGRISVDSSARAIVVVNSIKVAAQLVAALNCFAVRLLKRNESFATHIKSETDPALVRQIVRNFTSPESGRAILVIGAMWPHLDIPQLNCAYVACKLSQSSLGRLPGVVGRPFPGKKVGLIVDYASNELSTFGDAQSQALT